MERRKFLGYTAAAGASVMLPSLKPFANTTDTAKIIQKNVVVIAAKVEYLQLENTVFMLLVIINLVILMKIFLSLFVFHYYYHIF